MKLVLGIAAVIAAGTMLSHGAVAQELTYSIAPNSSITLGESPYSKLTRHPNEIYNPSPLLPYRTPEYTYYSYPTFEIRDVEIQRALPRRAAARPGDLVAAQQRKARLARQADVVARQQQKGRR